MYDKLYLTLAYGLNDYEKRVKKLNFILHFYVLSVV